MADSAKRREWTRVAFGDVVRQVQDRVDPERSGLDRYVAGEHMDTDDLRIRRWGAIADGYLGPAFHMRFKPGHVLYGSRRTYLRKVAVADFEGITANTTFVLESKDPHVLLPALLPFIMQTETFHDHSIKQSKGSVNPYINFSDLTWYEFDLPPLEEQRRIAEMLRAAESLIVSLDGVDAASDSALSSFLEDALGRLSTVAAVTTANLLLEPPRNGLSLAANDDEEGLQTVSISAVKEGQFNPLGCIKRVQVDAGVVRPYLVQQGDVFIVRGNGNRRLCGTAGFCDRSYDDLFYPDLLIRLRFDAAKVLPEFAVAQWNLPSVHRQLSSRAKSTNGTWKVNGQDVRDHTLLIPSIDEQGILVGQLRAFKTKQQSIRTRREAAARIKLAAIESLWGRND